MSDDQIIIVKRRKRAKHGHHGGAWKVAYADFVTAMMAFFLVMWILGVGTREQKAAIADYFKNPSMTPGASMRAVPGVMGPGGPSTSMIKLGGSMDLPKGEGKDVRQATPGKSPQSDDSKIAQEHDKARLEDLRKQLNAALDKSQALAPFKDQLLLDLTSEGLRIQIVDKQNRPMFDTGSATLKPYTVQILSELASFIDQVPNRISISGHTDSTPYALSGGPAHYSNWELSADRANAARRALLDGGMPEEKVTRVVGLAEAVPFDRAHPDDPSNRRISIVVMTEEAVKAAVQPEMEPTKPLPAIPSISVAVAAAGSDARQPVRSVQ
ncbi:flagellar motor protein MotB [Dyella sp.]|uniref:flagellar motor protein MotB n=1 Tax=Dyella sp. TaxID=1869338 RepID=UPI002ED38D64